MTSTVAMDMMTATQEHDVGSPLGIDTQYTTDHIDAVLFLETHLHR